MTCSESQHPLHQRLSKQHQQAYTHLTAFSRTTQASRCQKSKTNLDFTEARDSEWQWPDAQLLPNEQRQSTEGTCHPAG